MTELYRMLSRLLAYPTPSLAADQVQALALARTHCPAAVEPLERFSEQAGSDAERLGEVYSITFDVGPVCIPYVSVHLFGEESFKRSQLMTGLLERYQQRSYSRGSELPDHIALILGFAPFFDPEEWREMVRFVLAGALPKMIEPLEKAQSLYRYPLQALQMALQTELPREAGHA